MPHYTVKRLSVLAGVSVRTLHHYDAIGLLPPKARSASGYRLYGEEELLRLQQILFFRELDLPLEEIASVLDAPDFDPVRTLEEHRKRLEERLGRLHNLMETIEKTIRKYRGEEIMLKDEELYRGFTPEQAKRYRSEAEQKWGVEEVQTVEARMRRLSKEKLAQVQAEGEAVARDMAPLVGREPGDAEVQDLVARHHAWIENFYEAPAARYRGLARLYVENPEFTAFYDKHREGLAEFLCRAMEIYSDRNLK